MRVLPVASGGNAVFLIPLWSTFTLSNTSNDDSLDNLALACPDCNRFKGPNLTTLIPETREIIALFHPRQHRWEDHFEFHGALIVGRTDTGRATARLLNMNSDERVAMRAELMESGLM